MVKKKDLESNIENVVKKYLESDIIELVDVEFVKEGPNHYLRIYIDKPNGVTIDDCENVSRYVDEYLDMNDELITVPYYLEVSSPGLDRPLKKPADFQRSIGKHIEVKLYQNLDGNKLIQGILKNYDDNALTVILENEEELVLDHKQIALVKLAIIF
ncbi:MAG: ribosome maturation factor RimP [Tindallia sp. MSAO_Bac2]|nr:MAG: ribosome maturation factor RimP [Tindallia sp. MSAO_Bac2]